MRGGVDASRTAASVACEPHAEQILTRYADLLRVGQLCINGRRVFWNTNAANRLQLERFCAAFVGELKQLPAVRALEDEVLLKAAHLVCKALSINYVLGELMSVIRSRLKGKATDMYSISANGSSSPRPEYGVDVAADGGTVRAYVRWTGRGNIVCCDGRTAKMKVKGTLSHVETRFPMSPEPGFMPVYSMRVELQRSRLERFTSRLGHACNATAGPSRLPSVDQLQPGDPFVVSEADESVDADSCDAEGGRLSSERSRPKSGDYDEDTVVIQTATWDQE
mmetsp:Transcript_41445/g.117329  ORF Transcript_41445/g.117329 Transcript_41445/m.117329 type:complete len:280 (+) Transcript_41445:122-961(+)